MTLMMWEGLRRLKSLSLTKLTAGGAVVGAVPLKRPKASRWVWLKELERELLWARWGTRKRGVLLMWWWLVDDSMFADEASK